MNSSKSHLPINVSSTGLSSARATAEEEKGAQAIFSFVANNLNKNGAYNEAPLPDAPYEDYSWGDIDAQRFSPNLEEADKKKLTTLHHLVRVYLTIPSAANKARLYSEVKDTNMVRLFHPLAERLKEETLSTDIVRLADQWLHSSTHREPVKFAYLICGLYGLKSIYDLYSKSLYQDLFLLARCEEFTMYLCLACHLSNISPQQKFWYLVKHTKGWGKALSLAMLEYDTPEKRAWLLAHGLKLNILWPALSQLVILEGRLPQLIKQGDLTKAQFTALSDVILSYMLLLSPSEDFPQYEFGNFGPSLDTIDSYGLLNGYIELAETHAHTSADLAKLLAVKQRLELLAEDGTWEHLEPNKAQLLIGRFDMLICSFDWDRRLKQGLVNRKGQLNENLIDCAAFLQIDIWDRVYQYLYDHPTDLASLNYLLYVADNPPIGVSIHRAEPPQRLYDLLKLIDRSSKQLLTDEKALLLVLGFLQQHPGDGGLLIINALTSIYDQPRGMAALALSYWPKKDFTPSIRVAIVKAIHLNNDPFIDAVLNSLLDPNEASPINIEGL